MSILDVNVVIGAPELAEAIVKLADAIAKGGSTAPIIPIEENTKPGKKQIKKSKKEEEEKYTVEDLRQLTKTAIKAGYKETVKEILASFKVESVSDLAEKDYSEYHKQVSMFIENRPF